VNNVDKLRSIEVFREVIRFGSFSAAAESLQVVPSAVSRQVVELEQWLGVRLLYRTTRSLGLTDEGRRYLDRFEAIWDSVKELEAEAVAQRDEVIGTLRVTTFPYMASFLLQPVLSKLLTAHPKLNVTLKLTDRLVSIVDEGFDLAIRIGVLPNSNLIARRIGTVSMRTVAAPAYLDKHGIPEAPHDLTHHNCLYDSILARPNHRWGFEDKSKAISVPVKGNLVANSGKLLAELATTGMGIAYLPNFIVDQEIRAGRLVEILERYSAAPFPMSLVYPQSRQSSRALHLLADALAKSYSELGDSEKIQ